MPKRQPVPPPAGIPPSIGLSPAASQGRPSWIEGWAPGKFLAHNRRGNKVGDLAGRLEMTAKIHEGAPGRPETALICKLSVAKAYDGWRNAMKCSETYKLRQQGEE